MRSASRDVAVIATLLFVTMSRGTAVTSPLRLAQSCEASDGAKNRANFHLLHADAARALRRFDVVGFGELTTAGDVDRAVRTYGDIVSNLTDLVRSTTFADCAAVGERAGLDRRELVSAGADVATSIAAYRPSLDRSDLEMSLGVAIARENVALQAMEVDLKEHAASG